MTVLVASRGVVVYANALGYADFATRDTLRLESAFDLGSIAIEGGDVLNRAGGMMAARPHIVGYNCAGVLREVARLAVDLDRQLVRGRDDDHLRRE